MRSSSPPTLRFLSPTSSQRWLAGGLVALGCLGLLAIPLDLPLARRIDSRVLSGDLRHFFYLCEVFGHGTGVILIITAICLLAKSYRPRVPRVVLGVVLAGLIANSLKITIARVRPNHFFEFYDRSVSSWVSLCTWLDPLTQFSLNTANASQSFPSGHSATAAAFAVGLVWLLGRGHLYFAGLAFLACFQRVLFQYHWPSDAMVGAAIGGLTMMLVIHSSRIATAFQRWEKPASPTALPLNNNQRSAA